MARYTPLRVHIQQGQEKRFKRAVQNSGGATVRFSSLTSTSSPTPNIGILCLTRQQLVKVQRAPPGTTFTFIFSAAQIRNNVQHKGGFLPLLLAALAPILGGVIGGVAERAIAGSGIRLPACDGTVFWKRKNRTMKLSSNGSGLFLSPYTVRIPSKYGSGLFLIPPPYRGTGITKLRSKQHLPIDHPLRGFPINIFI